MRIVINGSVTCSNLVRLLAATQLLLEISKNLGEIGNTGRDGSPIYANLINAG